MSTATPSDVRGLIDTDLSDSAIQNYLDDAQFENERANDVGGLSTAHIRQIEKRLAAYKIRATSKEATRVSEGEATVEYDDPSLDELSAMVSAVDPSNQLASPVRRDTDRHVTSTGGSE